MIGQNPKAEVVDTVAKTPGEEAKKRILDKKRTDAFKPSCKKKISLARKRENTLRRNPSKS